MKAKQQTRNEEKKPLRKLPDLAVKKDVRRRRHPDHQADR
jgi:hypothetical protein